MQLSVIIVNFNVRVFLENALHSVFKAMAGIDGEVLVVDNASDDGSVDMVQKKFPAVRLFVNETNKGFAAANNRALKECRGTYILLLNPDTIIQEDTFRVMMDFMDKHPETGLAGCKILNPDGSLELACRRSFPTPWVAFTKIIGLGALFPHSRWFGKYNLSYLDPDQTYSVDALSGSFMFVRRSVYEQIGGLDEQFFMYGEDLDWCYRAQVAGWNISYVHATQIIHYKGESTRRSGMNEVKLFYEAMRVFVRKHIRRGVLSDIVLRTGIALREGIAFFGKISFFLRAAILDILFVNISVLLGEYFWSHAIFKFPSWSYPVIMTVPALAVVVALGSMGAYTKRKLSLARVASGVIVGYVILSALTFFFNQYAFSRMIVLISGAINILLLPGWRSISRTVVRRGEHRRGSLFGRRTLIVGTEKSGLEVLRKLRTRLEDGYEIVGFVDNNRKRVGEKISGVEILGSIDNIGKIIQEQKASEVIFSTDMLSYTEILSVIGRTRMPSVNFRLVPSSMEVIIGKAHIDELDDIPLVDIDYNIDKPSHRFVKRFLDIVCALVLMATVYPFVQGRKRPAETGGKLGRKILLMPEVLRGRMSFVGPPEFSLQQTRDGSGTAPVFLGLPGITGLVQINFRDDLSTEEIEKYNLYYAKNQTVTLDMEILMKSFILLLKK